MDINKYKRYKIWFIVIALSFCIITSPLLWFSLRYSIGIEGKERQYIFYVALGFWVTACILFVIVWVVLHRLTLKDNNLYNFNLTPIINNYDCAHRPNQWDSEPPLKTQTNKLNNLTISGNKDYGKSIMEDICLNEDDNLLLAIDNHFVSCYYAGTSLVQLKRKTVNENEQICACPNLYRDSSMDAQSKICETKSLLVCECENLKSNNKEIVTAL